MLRSRSIRIAVNQALVADETAARISASDEIALLPPLSGG
jgi:molybdopterin converting factor small subunit